MPDSKEIEGDDPDGTATFREAREYALGRLDVDHRHVHPVAGLIEDDDVRQTLSVMADMYDPNQEEIDAGMPRDFWETKFAQRALRKHATDALDAAVRDGNRTQAAYLSGLPSYRSDVSGLHAINQLADWLVHSEQCKLIYLAALMGRGKTDLSLLMLEVVHDHYRRLERSVGDDGVTIPTPEFAANFHVETPQDVEQDVLEISHFDDLLDWGEQGDSDQERWFIFDEASTELTAQSGGNAQDVAETMAPFVKKMRKMGINMIVIGHDKRDVHPAVRSLADYVDKADLKTASFYAGISKREPVGHLFDVDGIPPTSWDFDTDDTAEWCWCQDEQDEIEDAGMTDDEFKREVARRGASLWLSTGGQTGPLDQKDVADALSTAETNISRSMISRKAQEIEQEHEANRRASA